MKFRATVRGGHGGLMGWGLLAMAVMVAGPAGAREVTKALARGGDWAATERVPAGQATGNICLAIDPIVRMALRADATGSRLMVGNPHWDLPASVHSTIKLETGSDTRSLEVTGNSTNTVWAALDPSTLHGLLDEMAHTATMRVVVGDTTPLKVSLAGITVVLNAFRTCAGID